MRKLKIALIAIVAVIVLIVAGVWLLVDVNKFRPQIQAKLEEQLQRKVILGKMSLGLLPVRLTVDGVMISEDPAFKSSLVFIQAKQLDVSVGLLSLLTGSVKVNSIDLQDPSVELIRDRKGAWNFASLSRGADSAANQPAPAAASAGTPASGFSLGRLTIRNGKIAITDLQKNQPRVVYAPIDVTIRDYSNDGPFSFDIAAHMPGAASQEIRLKGSGGPLPSAGPAAMPLRATISLSNVDIANLRKFLDSEAVSKTTGTLSGETQIESQSGKLAAKGKLSVTGAKAGGVDIGYPIDANYDLSSEVATGIIKIASATLKLGATPLTVSGTINTNPTPVELDVRLQAGNTSIEEVARLASAFGIALAADTTVAGNLTGDVRARGPVTSLALNGNITGRDLKISGKNVPQPVEVKQLDLALTPSEIQSNEFQATTGKTTVTGHVAVRQYTSKTPVVDMALNAPSATLPELQSIAKAYGVTGLDQLSGAGALSFDLRAAGPVDTVASAGVMRALNGKINLNFNTMLIKGVDASSELSRIGGFLKSSGSGKGVTEVLKLTGNIIVKNGIAETNDLQASLNEGTLAAVGRSNLADESLDLRGTAVISKAVSDKAGGTGVTGYLKTALANDKGELVIPVMISGTFSKPIFAPDSQALLKMQRDRLLPGLDNPASALSGLLGGLTGKKPAPDTNLTQQPAQPQPKPADSLKGVLDGLFGGKK